MITVGGSGGTGTTPVDPAAYQGGGGSSNITTGKATVVNNTGAPVGDCTVSLKKVGAAGGVPTFESATIGDKSATSTSLTNGAAAHVQGLTVGTGQPPPAFELTLSGINMHGCEGATVALTTSAGTAINGVVVEASRIGQFEFTPLADSMRLGIEEVSNTAIFGVVVNTDSYSDISALSGTFLPAVNTSTSLVSVHLHHLVSGAPVTGAVGSVNGNAFSISGFAPLDQGTRVRLVGILSDAPGYNRLTRLQVEATYN